MGVYIKGMMMPRNCGTCEFRYFKKDECSWYSCSLLPSDIDEGSNGADIQDNCPLVEVPEPHGRLIDADFEEKHYASMTINPTPDVTPQDYMHSGYAAKAFQMAKTVIEAEGDNYDYERASDMRDYCERYEPTYNQEDGSM